MSNTVISVEGVWKAYERGRVRDGTLRSALAKWWSSPAMKKEVFFPLQDINFKVQEGDVVGIVGPNGAGKTTLLKILSRITFPTRGRIIIKGNLSSMLEVGAGFHPELTGRENVYLNGAIMGMRHAEISRKLDSIIAFAELDDFIETPVKHYSSGMYVRLAFSVGAHLEPDILLIDEILAVGDLSFRQKCLDKILDVSSEGRTVMMVSHQMSYLRTLCKNGMYLHEGRLVATGPIDQVIDTYIENGSRGSHQEIQMRQDRQGNAHCQVSSIRFRDDQGDIPPIFSSGQRLYIQVELFSTRTTLQQVEIILDCFDFLGRQWFSLNNNISDGVFLSCDPHAILECTIYKLPLNEGRFYFDVSVYCEKQLCDQVHHAVEFEVEKGLFYPTGRLPQSAKGMLVEYQWTLATAT